MKVLIAGGTGLIGRALVMSLIVDGHEVVILSRKEHKSTEKYLKYAQWNAKEIPDLKEEFDAYINLSGEPVADKAWSKKQRERLLRSRTDSTRAFVKHIQSVKKKPHVFINASAMGYYGDKGKNTVTEGDPPGDDFLASLTQKWEAAAEGAGVRTVLLRTSNVLSNNGGAFPQLKMPLNFGFGAYFGSGKQGFPWIHIDDEVGIIRFAMENDKLEGAGNMAAPEMVTNKEFTKEMADIKSKPFVMPVPNWMLELGLGARAEMLEASLFLKPGKLLKTGYEFRYPKLRDALKDLLN